MDKMNVPGFTADASLYANAGTYRAGYSGGHQQVVPQNWLGDLGRAMWNDIKGAGNLFWGGVRCTVATTAVGVHCVAGAETGDGSECANAISDWTDNCIVGD
jgi:hypothetical protein